MLVLIDVVHVAKLTGILNNFFKVSRVFRCRSVSTVEQKKEAMMNSSWRGAGSK